MELGFKTIAEFARAVKSLVEAKARTIGVWVGKPDGAPVPGLTGRTAAAPILFDAFARIGGPPAPLPVAPKGALIAATGKLPPPLQRFRPGAAAGGSGEAQLRIMFPPMELGSILQAMMPVAPSRSRSR
jgi:hypothetical protein